MGVWGSWESVEGKEKRREASEEKYIPQKDNQDLWTEYSTKTYFIIS